MAVLIRTTLMVTVVALAGAAVASSASAVEGRGVGSSEPGPSIDGALVGPDPPSSGCRPMCYDVTG